MMETLLIVTKSSMRSGDSCAGRSSKKLEDTRRIVAETEEVGIAVLDTLAQQRESLLGTHEKVRSSRHLSQALQHHIAC